MTVLLVSLPIAIAAVLSFFLWHSNSLRPDNPLSWPSALPRKKLISITQRYLRSQGWKIYPPYEWHQITIRAMNGDQALYLYVDAESVLTLRTLVRDIIDRSRVSGFLIGVLTLQFIDSESKSLARDGGIYVIAPKDLSSIAELIKAATLRRLRWKEHQTMISEAVIEIPTESS